MGEIHREILPITMANITHHHDKNCFILSVEEGVDLAGEANQAVLEYQLLADHGIDFTRTFVPNEFRGKGYAEKLVRKGLAWAKEEGFSVQASCWYVAKFLR